MRCVEIDIILWKRVLCKLPMETISLGQSFSFASEKYWRWLTRPFMIYVFLKVVITQSSLKAVDCKAALTFKEAIICVGQTKTENSNTSITHGVWTILATQAHFSLVTMVVCSNSRHIKEGCRFVCEEWRKERAAVTERGKWGPWGGMRRNTVPVCELCFLREGSPLSLCLNHSQGAAGYPQCSSVPTPRSNSYQIPPSLILSIYFSHQQPLCLVPSIFPLISFPWSNYLNVATLLTC